jgi:Carboxypeptidase regulatory-like domain
MRTIQQRKLNMYLAVKIFLLSNEAIMKVISKFEECFAFFLNLITEIQSVGEAQKINRTGLATDKNKLKEALIALAADISRKIAAFAKLTDNNTLLKEVRFRESDFYTGPEAGLKDYAQIIYDKAEANMESLAEFGITPDTQKTLSDAINAFNNALATPRYGITQKSQATKQLALLFDSADSALEKLDYLVGMMKLQDPNFYNGYKTARRLVDTGSGKLALKATVKDITSGEPVHGATLLFRHDITIASGNTGNGEIKKKTTQKGRLQIKNMPAGTYQVVISKTGYKEKTVSVSVSDGERSDMNVDMEKA